MFIVDCSNILNTRIKVEENKKFALNQGDFINLGLSSILNIEITKCTNENLPAPHTPEYTNIRYLPIEIAAESAKRFMNDKNRQNKPPNLPEIELTIRSTNSYNGKDEHFNSKGELPIRIGRSPNINPTTQKPNTIILEGDKVKIIDEVGEEKEVSDL